MPGGGATGHHPGGTGVVTTGHLLAGLATLWQSLEGRALIAMGLALPSAVEELTQACEPGQEGDFSMAVRSVFARAYADCAVSISPSALLCSLLSESGPWSGIAKEGENGMIPASACVRTPNGAPAWNRPNLLPFAGGAPPESQLRLPW